MREPPVVAIVGPTAAGKSRLAVRLARRLGGEILCGDSRQLYRRLQVGTDKVPAQEQEGIPHHLQDTVEPEVAVSAGLFVRLAEEALAGIRRRGGLPLLVGGSGLYIEAFLGGLFAGPAASAGLRRRLLQAEELRGAGWLQRMLLRLDPQTAARVGPRDRQRVVRALEVRLLTGEPLSRQLARHQETRAAPRPQVRIGLSAPREVLYRRIDERVERMLAGGLVEEIRGLLAGGLDPAAPALSAIGYAEVLRFLRGELPGGLAEARSLIQRNTRRLAKRQTTWFGRHGPVTWFEGEGEGLAERIEAHLAPLLQ